MIRGTAWDLLAGMSGQLTGLLDEYGGEPGWWAGDVRRLARRLRDAATGEHVGVPTDLRTGAGPGEALDRFQRLIGRFGHLLTHWHDLAEAVIESDAGARKLTLSVTDYFKNKEDAEWKSYLSAHKPNQATLGDVMPKIEGEG